ncbi:MAG: hypothetical protein J6J33_02560 [Clostridia bacterium]|nr:hypothetical protein [Clostridia bacterium]
MLIISAFAKISKADHQTALKFSHFDLLTFLYACFYECLFFGYVISHSTIRYYARYNMRVYGEAVA